MYQSDHPALTQKEAVRRETAIAISLMENPTEGTMYYVGWGGKTASVSGEMFSLGFDYGRAARTPRFGIRRAIWDFCFGYVSGFPLKDIVWFVYSRSLSKERRNRHVAREREAKAAKKSR